MANQLQEYMRRHGSDYITAIDEGVVFFSDSVWPVLACTTSSPGRTAKTCALCCRHKEALVAEYWFLSNGGNGFGSIGFHRHIDADADLFQLTRELYGNKLVPFVAKSDDEAEAYLWNAFYSQYIERTLFITETAIENLYREAARNPGNIDTFVKVLYQRILMGRRYILVDPSA